MPKKRHSGLDALDEGFAYVQIVEGAHHLTEVAYAGEEDFGGASEAGGIVDERVFTAEFIEGVLHGAQVAGAVIEDGNHKSPLVEGS